MVLQQSFTVKHCLVLEVGVGRGGEVGVDAYGGAGGGGDGVHGGLLGVVHRHQLYVE